MERVDVPDENWKKTQKICHLGKKKKLGKTRYDLAVGNRDSVNRMPNEE